MSLMPLLVAPMQRTKPLPPQLQALFGSDIDLGWLAEGETGAYWMTWGSSKDTSAACRCVREVLQKSEHEVLFWNRPLPKQLTVAQVAEIRCRQPEMKEAFQYVEE